MFSLSKNNHVKSISSLWNMYIWTMWRHDGWLILQFARFLISLFCGMSNTFWWGLIDWPLSAHGCWPSLPSLHYFWSLSLSFGENLIWFFVLFCNPKGVSFSCSHKWSDVSSKFGTLRQTFLICNLYWFWEIWKQFVKQWYFKWLVMV